MNCKGKGSRCEHKSKRLLEAAGYACMKAGASLGVFDLIGIGSQDFVLVQVKANRWPLEAEMESLRLFKAPMNEPQTHPPMA
jgi:Holliday junction resolvase